MLRKEALEDAERKRKEAAEPPKIRDEVKEAADHPKIRDEVKEAAGHPKIREEDLQGGEEDERDVHGTRVVPDVEYEPTEPGDDPKDDEIPAEEKAQIQVHRLAIPLPDKRGITILNALVDIYLQLRHEGMNITQVHSDLGGEFVGARLDKWCRERCILHSTTAGVEPQSNGRAERAVQAMKTETKKILRAAEVGLEYWPIAVRYLNEVWRRQRIKTKGVIPPFMAKVLIRKRYWRTQDLEPNNEEAHYLTPSWLSHGHWVLRSDGTQALTRSVITNTTEPVTEDVWIALEDSLTPLDMRRRIRGKMMVRKLEEHEDERREEKERGKG